ncbi:MAG: hypothetical protein RL685_280 [Pseudomonadota bacterium]|jgi:ActR/RegA family two-component response regulator
MDTEQQEPAPEARRGRQSGWRSLVAGLPSASSPALTATASWPSLERIQWEYIHAVLDACGGNISEAARQLGMHRQSLQRMLRRLPPCR